MKNYEIIADVLEAVELVKKYNPVYTALLKMGKSKQEALDAVRFLVALERGEI